MQSILHVEVTFATSFCGIDSVRGFKSFLQDVTQMIEHRATAKGSDDFIGFIRIPIAVRHFHCTIHCTPLSLTPRLLSRATLHYSLAAVVIVLYCARGCEAFVHTKS